MKEYLSLNIRTVICSYMPLMDLVSQMANLSTRDRKRLFSWNHHGNQMENPKHPWNILQQIWMNYGIIECRPNVCKKSS